MAAVSSGTAKVTLPTDEQILITREFDAPRHLVYEAWTKPELFKRWWIPKSAPLNLLSCEMDVRVGGGYRLVFAHGGSNISFFGTYTEVTPHSRLAWTNDESEDGQLTTVSFEERGGKTLLVMHELYPSKEALERASGSENGMPETFDQLDELLVALGAGSS